MLTARFARTPDDLGDVSNDEWFERWRARELRRVDRAGLTYADYTGTALYPESLVAADALRLRDGIFGNPHSQSTPSLASTAVVDDARRAVLDFLHADRGEYTVVFTANASAACKLVAEAFPFSDGSVLALSTDNHNSVLGMREYAARRGARVTMLPLDDELRLSSPHELLEAAALRSARAGRTAAPSLLAYPAQSNFSGVHHPLELLETARNHGWYTFLDAAAFLPTADLDLRETKPDFVCLSLYKIAGYPCGVGALVARRQALSVLQRQSFAGGTVLWASVRRHDFRLIPDAQGFEDGTPAFLSLGSVPAAIEAVSRVDRRRLGIHLRDLTAQFLSGINDLRCEDGTSAVLVHGPRSSTARGATVALTIRSNCGHSIPFWEVESAARAAGIAVRGGCFCNPGCAERAFGFDSRPMDTCLQSLGQDFSIPRFAECMGDGAVGAIRVSLGLGSVRRDVVRLLAFLATVVNSA